MAKPSKDLYPKDFFRDGKPRPLVFGKSFTDPSDDEEFLSVTYDFKPPCSDKSQTTLELGSDNNVNISVRQGGTDDTTLYRGSVQEANKECFLVIDHVTGEITLERVSSVIRVKRTREPGSGGGGGGGSSRAMNTTPQDHSRMNHNNQLPVSESMPDLDDFEEVDDEQHSPPPQQLPPQHSMPSIPNEAGSNLSESSSSSSSDSSSSDSDSDDGGEADRRPPPQQHKQHKPPNKTQSDQGISSTVLKDDLQLSSASEDE